MATFAADLASEVRRFGEAKDAGFTRKQETSRPRRERPAAEDEAGDEPPAGANDGDEPRANEAQTMRWSRAKDAND